MSSNHTRKIMTALKDRGAGVSAQIRFPWQSWDRCLTEHRLSPGDCNFFPALSLREVDLAQDAMGERFSLACAEVEFLTSVVGRIGYSVSMANADCVIVLKQTDVSSDRKPPMEKLGSIWRESDTGTNGVGTCLQQLEATSVFLDEHFFSNFVNFACAAAPLFAPDCTVWGALDTSIHDPNLHAQTHALAFEVLCSASERLNETVFRHEFRGATILKLREKDARSCLIAVDDDFAVVGADRAARKALDLPLTRLAPFSLWLQFERNPDGLRVDGSGNAAVELVRRSDGLRVRGTASCAHGRRSKGGAEKADRPVRGGSDLTLDSWAGAEPRMVETVRVLRRLMHAGLPILILGETGVGKDALARAYHAESARRTRPFVVVNCGAVPESLIESELFGYVGGAFTGARKEGAPGVFCQADGGTLFLDEIGDMPLALQTRLLRVLDSGEVSPLGSGKRRHVDVQVIAATNRKLEQHVASGEFREDLYHRLAGVVVDVPALRERVDLAAIIDRVVAQAARNPSFSTTQGARERLLAHEWPGNLRELNLVIRRAAAMATDCSIKEEDLLLRTTPATSSGSARRPVRTSAGRDQGLGFRVEIEQAERAAIVDAMHRSQGDVMKAATALGMSRATFYRRLKAHQISPHA